MQHSTRTLVWQAPAGRHRAEVDALVQHSMSAALCQASAGRHRGQGGGKVPLQDMKGGISTTCTLLSRGSSGLHGLAVQLRGL